jgi:hypothetical protein
MYAGKGVNNSAIRLASRLACFVTFAIAAPASAFCEYRGQLYAETTIQQEFADSRWVVRARLVSVTEFREERYFPGTLYRLEVVETFKGSPPRDISLYTQRNSGGFYLYGRPDEPIGAEWLLFLNPGQWGAPDDPPAARGATWVNYACGQSRMWSAVPSADRQLLRRAAGSNGHE